VPFRWVIGLLLFASTVINYIDRQTLSVLAPYIKTEFRWSNTDFAFVIIAFRAAYAIGQTLSGRLLDRIGTRAGLMASVTFYSIVAVATSLASGFRSLVTCRFLLGLGESANWPGATKAVAEWFPRRESGWAVALFDSGSSIGGALAPIIVLGVYRWFGSWRPAFIVTGLLGFVWLIAFRALYRSPEVHERVSPEELKVILEGRQSGIDPARAADRLPYGTLLRLPQTWGIVIGKTLSDPVWFFITDWFAIYLVSRNYRLEDSLMAFWVPFLAADLGNFAGGGLSSWLISRGWSVGAARKLVVVLGGAGMTLLAPTVFVDSFTMLVACFAVATFSYAALSTMILNLPADVYPTGSVASVSGLSGTGAGIGTIAATLLTGTIADRLSFSPILIGASLVPLGCVAAVLLLVKNTEATRRGELRAI
jgi:MFS transporter, ACS family, aldohexuronate transporter